MSKQLKMDQYYLRSAFNAGSMSKDEYWQVGAVIVKDNVIIADGWNGTPFGFYTNDTRTEDGETLDCVVHAEQNALAKCARQGLSCDGGTMYINVGPCPHCATLIKQAGIKRVVYAIPYRLASGVALLEDLGIEVERISL